MTAARAPASASRAATAGVAHTASTSTPRALSPPANVTVCSTGPPRARLLTSPTFIP